MLTDAIKPIVPQENSILSPMVASWLFDVAITKYESDLNNGKVVEIVEFQDASGFISRVESMVIDAMPMHNQTMKSSVE